MKTDVSGIATELTKATPPVGITVAALSGVPLQEWVLILTMIYTILQIVFLLRAKLADFRGSK